VGALREEEQGLEFTKGKMRPGTQKGGKKRICTIGGGGKKGEEGGKKNHLPNSIGGKLRCVHSSSIREKMYGNGDNENQDSSPTRKKGGGGYLSNRGGYVDHEEGNFSGRRKAANAR